MDSKTKQILMENQHELRKSALEHLLRTHAFHCPFCGTQIEMFKPFYDETENEWGMNMYCLKCGNSSHTVVRTTIRNATIVENENGE